MRKIITALSLLLLASCSTDSDVVQAGNLLWRAVAGSNEKIPRERAAAVPYATMGLELGPNPQALLILGQRRDEESDWFAGDQLFVATRRGRVIRTAGLPYDLGGVGTLPAAGDTLPIFTFDFPDLSIFGAPAQCARRDAGGENVEILGASIATRRIVEHCEVPALKWKFDNEYWEDPATGYVWRSRQYIHPKSPPIVLEVLRPEQMGPG
jgi:hypothetical protein